MKVKMIVRLDGVTYESAVESPTLETQGTAITWSLEISDL